MLEHHVLCLVLSGGEDVEDGAEEANRQELTFYAHKGNLINCKRSSLRA